MDLDDLKKQVHAANIKWWVDINSGLPIERNKGENIALIHSELSEALEGVRKNLDDDKVKCYPMEVVEMIDALIRIFDYLGGYWPDLDIQKVFDAKMRYNAQRKDHSLEHRRTTNGKKF